MGDIKASMSGSPTGPCLVSTVKPGPVPTLDASDLKWQPFYPPLRPALKTMGQCSTKCLLLLWATSADNKSCWSYRLSSVVVWKQVWEEICPQSPGKLERPAWPWCSWASEGGSVGTSSAGAELQPCWTGLPPPLHSLTQASVCDGGPSWDSRVGLDQATYRKPRYSHQLSCNQWKPTQGTFQILFVTGLFNITKITQYKII